MKNQLCSSKHAEGKKRLETKTAGERDIVAALKSYNSKLHPQGKTLSETQQEFQSKVMKTFLRAGVAVSKIDNLRELLEETSYWLSHRRYMLDLIPFIRREDKTRIKQEISGKHVGVVFDSTTHLGEALAIVLRSVSDSWTVEPRVVCVQLLLKSLTGDEIACELISVLLTNYRMGSKQLIAAMKDRASVNGVAMRTMKIIFPTLMDVGFPYYWSCWGPLQNP